jgi:hypothetical protein
VPIKHEANGDVGGTVSGGTDGADLDLADQTLVEDVSRDADVSLIQEIAVSGISAFLTRKAFFSFLASLF